MIKIQDKSVTKSKVMGKYTGGARNLFVRGRNNLRLLSEGGSGPELASRIPRKMPKAAKVYLHLRFLFQVICWL